MTENLFREFKVAMAPMSDVNTPAFCSILRDHGCELIYTGLLTSHGIVNQNSRTFQFIDTLPEGVAYVGQIFGSVPEVMAEAARALEASGKFAAIDINMGCPVPKVVKTNAGVGLMREPELAGRIVRAVAGAVRIPVSVKIRAGWDSKEINCIEFGIRSAGEGAAAVALHPRTRTQGYGGVADWSLVMRLKEKLSVPVIGSGDIRMPEDASRRISETGCDAVMIGRASRGDPTLPGRVRRHLSGEGPCPPPSPGDLLTLAALHYERHIAIEGPERGARSLRGHLAFYLKGFHGAADTRKKIFTSDEPCEILHALEALRANFDDGLRNVL